MNQYIFKNSKNEYFKRISKITAKKEFESGNDIVIVACNLQPFGFWGLGIETSINNWGFEGIPENERFEKLVNGYTWYNCNHETGYYPAYYVRIEQ